MEPSPGSPTSSSAATGGATAGPTPATTSAEPERPRAAAREPALTPRHRSSRYARNRALTSRSCHPCRSAAVRGSPCPKAGHAACDRYRIRSGSLRNRPEAAPYRLSPACAGADWAHEGRCDPDRIGRHHVAPDGGDRWPQRRRPAAGTHHARLGCPAAVSAGSCGLIYHLRLDDRDVMVAEHDLAGPLLDLVTAVLAKGDPV